MLMPDVERRKGWSPRRTLAIGMLAAALVALVALVAWGAFHFSSPDSARQAEAESPLHLLDPRTWKVAPDERKKPHEQAGELLDHVEKNPAK
jgi:hypothetical protein